MFLQATPLLFSLSPSSWLSLLALAFAVWNFFRKESREDGQTTSQRLKKMEVEQANQAVRQMGLQGEIENVADTAQRARTAMEAGHRRDIDSLRDQIKDVPTLRELLYRMVERLDNTSKAVEKLDAKMDKIVDLLTHPK